MPQMHTLTICAGPLSTNAYIVYRGKKAFIIDAPPNSLLPIQEALDMHHLTPTHLILTHSHWDHIADAKKIHDHYNIPVLVHADDAYNLLSPGADRVPGWLQIEAAAPNLELHDNDMLSLLDTSWRVIHTPGHTPGGICLYNEDEHLLFAGDTLFRGSFGNVSFATGDPQRMIVSLKRLAELPAETKVFPGHGPRTAIDKEQWLHNPEKLVLS